MTNEKRERLKLLLLQRAQQNNTEKPVDPPIVQQKDEAKTGKGMIDQDRILPLSLNQQAIWLAHEIAPLSPAYNTVFAIKFLQVVDAPRLENACNALLARHDMLRSSFFIDGDEPKQIVTGKLSLKLNIIDGTAWDEKHLDKTIRDLSWSHFLSFSFQIPV